ncbi:MAG: hypothetical protein ABIN89_26685 [Chitinophagaceae bacterium]
MLILACVEVPHVIEGVVILASFASLVRVGELSLRSFLHAKKTNPAKIIAAGTSVATI